MPLVALAYLGDIQFLGVAELTRYAASAVASEECG
jgi:hypothetical protein